MAQEVKDPVCGMTLDRDTARKAKVSGLEYAFCSELCRQKFLAHPRDYLESAP